jgi:hypothetical protein
MNLDRPVVQSLARHYTDWASPAPEAVVPLTIQYQMIGWLTPNEMESMRQENL